MFTYLVRFLAKSSLCLSLFLPFATSQAQIPISSLKQSRVPATRASISSTAIPTWAYSYDSEDREVGRANSVVPTNDGGYIAAGYVSFNDRANQDMWLLKLNRYGQRVWETTLGGSNHDAANAVIETANGDLVVAGYTRSFGAGSADCWVLRLTSIGDILWQKSYGGSAAENCSSIVQTSDSGFITAGRTASFGAGGTGDGWIVKLDALGNVQWEQSYGGSGTDSFSSIIESKPARYIAVGTTTSFGSGSFDAWAVRLNQSGNPIWQRTYGGTELEGATRIRSFGTRYLLVGSVGQNGQRDLIVLQLQNNGDVLWQKRFGDLSDDIIGRDVVSLGFAGSVVAAYTATAGGGYGDMLALRLDNAGNVQWEQSYGGVPFMAYAPRSLERTLDGGYIFGGYIYNPGTGLGTWTEDALVVKMNQDGELDLCSLDAPNTTPVINSSFSSLSSTALVQPTLSTASDTTASPVASMLDVFPEC